MTTAIIPATTDRHHLDGIPTTTADVVARMADFLRLNVANGDASESTIKAYLAHVGQFVQWCWEAGIDPGRATETDLAVYRRYLVADAGCRRSTITVKLSALRRFFQAAVWHGLRPDNPAEGLKPPRAHTTRRDRILERYLSPIEVMVLLAAPDPSTPAGARDRAMITLMYYHALRVSEVAALHLHHLKRGDPTQLHVVGGKGHKDRVVLITSKSAPILDAWLTVRPSVANHHSGQATFISLSKANHGAQITPAGARWVVKQHLRKTGLYRPGIGPHALRHAHASHALANGADLNALAAEMGHASIQTTTVYTHVVDAVTQNPAEFL